MRQTMKRRSEKITGRKHSEKWAKRAELTLKVDEDEVARHLTQWQAPEPRYARGVWAKYARLVSPASRGAVAS